MRKVRTKLVKSTSRIGRWAVLTIVTLSLANCGRVIDKESDDAYFADANNAKIAAEAQKSADNWYAAFEKNVPVVRGAVSSQSVPQVSPQEIQSRVLHIVSLVENAQQQSSRGAYQTQQWYGRYGGTNTYSSGQTANGGYVKVKTRYNPNVQSGGGTATGGGLVTYNGTYGAGAAGIHVGLAGVCAGAAGANKSTYASAGCGGCVSWGGQAYGGCF